MPFQRAISTDTPRLLLLLDNARDWKMLVDRFESVYDVRVAIPDDDWGAFDCCVVDEQTLPQVADDLAALKSAAEPVFLPVLLLARSERSAAALLSSSGSDVADETLTVPTQPNLLTTRLRSLLRMRMLSLRLDDERKQYQALVESSTDAVVVFDDTCAIRYTNPAAETMFGYAAAALIGESVGTVLPDAYWDDVTTGSTPDTPAATPLQGRHADGHEFPVEMTVAVVAHDDERQYTATIRDVTHREERKQQLERSRDLLEKTQRLAGVGGWEIDPSTGTVTGTDETYRIHDLPSDSELTFDEVLESYHPEDVPVAYEAIDQVLRTGEPFDVNLRLQLTRGERWVRVRGEAVHENGTRMIRGAVQDITERIEREQELEASERRFRAIFEGANAAMVIANDHGEYLEVNPAATDLFGLPEAELIGRTITEFAPPDYDFDGEWERFRQGESVTGEFPLVRPDGTQLSTRFSATPNILPGRHLSVLRDVTDRKARKDELERFETIVEAAPDPIYALDADGTFITVNSALATATGRAVDELIGTNLEDLLDPAQMAASREHAAALRAGDDPGPLRLTIQTPAGPKRYEFNVVVYGEQHENGDTGTVGVARDVTDLYEREQRLSVLDRVLRHNIRNKLNVVVGRAGGLIGDDSATVRASATAIIDAADELLRMSETARQFEATIQPDNASWTTIDLATQLPNVVEDVTMTYPEVTVSLEFDAGSDGPWTVETQETLPLAIEELIENAIVHCDRTPEIHISVINNLATPFIELSVADNGPGIEAVERNALARGLETPLEHMSGLGLWFVRWTVEASGGTFSIEANEPRGTVIRLRLPRADAG